MVTQKSKHSPSKVDKKCKKPLCHIEGRGTNPPYQSIIDKRVGLSIIDKIWNLTNAVHLTLTLAHRVEAYSPHLPDAYNSRSAGLSIIAN
jgi:hypothetical protein